MAGFEEGPARISAASGLYTGVTPLMQTGSMKQCPKCRELLPLRAFGFRDKSHTRIQSYCRTCTNVYWTHWYGLETNRRRLIDGATKRRRVTVDQNRLLVRAAKAEPCSDCGQYFPPEVMDFDHVGGKTADISRMIYTHGLDALKRELENCHLVCANCHRVRTAWRFAKLRA